MIGRTLSHYKVLEKIGEGGMGEVYLAKDTKLDREVAVKVLPATFSENKERLARFEREARLLASLNHPNIAAIHELEESEGVHFLALEYVPGETLAERIKRGPVPVDEALPLFKQIAEGLEAAHDKGVIHRDLKPANIKVTPEGKVKVLDFGLAKALVSEVIPQDLSQSPTMTREGTELGVLLGTAPYMSPEQARGKPVDKRTDIWAFGCCLYEALTGQKVFDGETVTDVIAAVVTSEPDWSALPENLPWKIKELLERGLRKDRGVRLRDIGDARLDLEDAVAEPSAGPAAAFPSTSPRRRAFPFIATAMAGALLAGVILWRLVQSSPPPVRHLSINLPVDDDFPSTTMGVSALSPDGKHIVYVANRDGVEQLYLRSMDRLKTVPLQGSEGARGPFFSPDSRWIGFQAGTTLKKMALAGGPVVELCDSLYLYGASWAPDDTILFSSSSHPGLWRISASGGTPEVVTVLKEEEQAHRWPRFLPGGKAVLFTVQFMSPADTSVAVMSLETGERWNLMKGTYPWFVPTGHIVFAQSGSLMTVPFEPKLLEIAGPPTPVLDGVQFTESGAARFCISDEGSLLYVPGDRDTEVRRKLVWVDRQGTEQSLSEESRFFYPHPRLSPDGRRLAVTVATPDETDVWILELARGALTRLTFDGYNLRPIWSPDGRRVIFGSNRVDDTFNIFSKVADGSREAEEITTGAYRIPTALSSDGKLLIFRQLGGNSSWDIGRLRLDGESEPKIILGTDFDEHTGMLSPNDRWLAYVSNESGREEVYVCSFPDLGGKVQVSIDGGTEPVWSRDGGELFYRNGEKMMGVAFSTTPNFAPSKPTLLFDGPYEMGRYEGNPSSNYDVSPAGRFVMIRAEKGSGRRQMNIVLNWFEELKRLVPTN